MKAVRLDTLLVLSFSATAQPLSTYARNSWSPEDRLLAGCEYTNSQFRYRPNRPASRSNPPNHHIQSANCRYKNLSRSLPAGRLERLETWTDMNASSLVNGALGRNWTSEIARSGETPSDNPIAPRPCSSRHCRKHRRRRQRQFGSARRTYPSRGSICHSQMYPNQFRASNPAQKCPRPPSCPCH